MNLHDLAARVLSDAGVSQSHALGSETLRLPEPPAGRGGARQSSSLKVSGVSPSHPPGRETLRLRRILAGGPKSESELLAATGWTLPRLWDGLGVLLDHGEVQGVDGADGVRRFQIAASDPATWQLEEINRRDAVLVVSSKRLDRVVLFVPDGWRRPKGERRAALTVTDLRKITTLRPTRAQLCQLVDVLEVFEGQIVP
jgi:hypothetical protein